MSELDILAFRRILDKFHGMLQQYLCATCLCAVNIALSKFSNALGLPSACRQVLTASLNLSGAVPSTPAGFKTAKGSPAAFHGVASMPPHSFRTLKGAAPQFLKALLNPACRFGADEETLRRVLRYHRLPNLERLEDGRLIAR